MVPDSRPILKENTVKLLLVKQTKENFNNFAILHFARVAVRELQVAGLGYLGPGGDPREVLGLQLASRNNKVSLKDGGLNGGDPIGG